MGQERKLYCADMPAPADKRRERNCCLPRSEQLLRRNKQVHRQQRQLVYEKSERRRLCRSSGRRRLDADHITERRNAQCIRCLLCGGRQLGKLKLRVRRSFRSFGKPARRRCGHRRRRGMEHDHERFFLIYCRNAGNHHHKRRQHQCTRRTSGCRYRRRSERSGNEYICYNQRRKCQCLWRQMGCRYRRRRLAPG